MKDLLLRVYKDKTIHAVFSDGLTIEELELVKEWATDRISQERSMEPKFSKKATERLEHG